MQQSYENVAPIIPIDDLDPVDVDAILRISSRAFKSGDCIEAGRGRDSTGYAVFSVVGLRTQVARYLTAIIEDLNYEDRSWQTRHTCDNPSCINPAHLLSGTPAQNAEDKYLRGRSTRGERSASAKLAYLDVLAIRMYSNISNELFAEWLGVSRKTIQSARSGLTWHYLNDIFPTTNRISSEVRSDTQSEMQVQGINTGGGAALADGSWASIQKIEQ